MFMVFPLSNITPGESAQIVFLANEDCMNGRLRELGFEAGAVVSCVSQRPKKNISAYQINHSTIALREDDSRFIFVRPLEDAESDTPVSKGRSTFGEFCSHILAAPVLGTLCMFLLLTGILWLTVIGANYPSAWMQEQLFRLEAWLAAAAASLGVPQLLIDTLIFGVYRVVSWVVSVVLPPMAIFFPLFTLLEELGCLPRIAYRMDGAFQKCSTCGKQCLTMAMGLGCNAAGVTGCRMIDSPRERLIAILTNSLMPCNGRFPLLITMISLATLLAAGGANLTSAETAATYTPQPHEYAYTAASDSPVDASIPLPDRIDLTSDTISVDGISGATSSLQSALHGTFVQSLMSAVLLAGLILLSVIATLGASWLLSRTILKGVPSSFTLELPACRRPNLRRILIRSWFDRTLPVLGRSVVVAAPAGLLIWVLANMYIPDGSLLPQLIETPAAHQALDAPANASSLLTSFSSMLDPLGRLMGLDGIVLMAFILGFPANEIVLPIILMAYLQSGQLTPLEDTSALAGLLAAHGWTLKTYACMAIFSLFHWPCSTTCLTVKKETGSWKWTLVAFLLPTVIGMGLCIGISSIFS